MWSSGAVIEVREFRRQDQPEVLRLRVGPGQESLVASVRKSLAQVADDATLTAYAVCEVPDESIARGAVSAESGTFVGFAVLEVAGDVGFVLRLLIDARHQGKGYGTAALGCLIAILQDDLRVRLIATSHREDNPVVARLCARWGFRPWETPFDPPAGEVYLRLR